MKLQREVTLRQSVEDAHEALLMRIRDMEEVVDSERGQVSDLVDNWNNAKRQAEATKEAFENEHDLRTHLEGLVTQHEEQYGKECVSYSSISSGYRPTNSPLSKLTSPPHTVTLREETSVG